MKSSKSASYNETWGVSGSVVSSPNGVWGRMLTKNSFGAY